MEDRFKFRAFDTSDGRMIYSIDEEHKREYSLVEFQIGFSSYDLSDLRIMQCTGTKDKNGKLIYEGDILGGSNGSINGAKWGIKPFEIIWNQNRAEFNVPIWGTLEHYDNTHWLEVIGNIYENPELLK